VIRSLDDAARKYFGDYLYATGPGFFDAALRRYIALPPTAAAARITVLPPIYFLPTFDPSESEVISGKCFPTRMRSLPAKAQIMCRRLARRSFHNDIDPLAYANHHWIHAYMFDESWKKENAQNVFRAVPAIKSAVIASMNFDWDLFCGLSARMKPMQLVALSAVMTRYSLSQADDFVHHIATIFIRHVNVANY